MSRYRASALCVVALLLPRVALAIPTAITSLNDKQCDALSLPSVVEELVAGKGVPKDSLIAASVVLADAGVSACAATDDPEFANVVLEITNKSGRDYAEVWYVTDILGVVTTISGFDGFVNGSLQSFRIDATGVNTPLLSESMAADGVFQHNESWTFIVQDYVNSAALPPDSLGSIGLDSSTKASTGNIIAVVVPEPGTAGLVALGLGGLALTRRR